MSLIAASPEPVFFLVDLALYPRAHQQMFEVEDTPTYQLLYLQTPYRQHAQQGPLLTQPSTPRAQATAAQWVEQGVAIAIHADRPFTLLVDHLRSLTRIRRQKGPPALFRYADPRLYAGLESALSRDDITRLMGPARQMYGVAGGNAWSLESPSGQPYAPPGDDFMLTVAHEQAMQTWREGVFLQQLASEYALPVSCTATWLLQMKELALETEYARWEGCRILADSGHQSPLSPQQMDRLQDHAGPWQHMLSCLHELVTASPSVDKEMS
ncbi:DUF4123 domain-containing protein [Litchfieldella rifensis]|uniref:DUF4123 domain-containing protein n=1 Tax=Litchfieldella rifensis TaxID=762643 RepID=A0ABV7LR65_9GAMM